MRAIVGDDIYFADHRGRKISHTQGSNKNGQQVRNFEVEKLDGESHKSHQRQTRTAVERYTGADKGLAKVMGSGKDGKLWVVDTRKESTERQR